MVIFFEKIFRIRLNMEKHIRNREVMVPSLNFPLKRRGKKNLKKIINKTKYTTACMPNLMT
jgi:hypothetical protein